MSLKSLKNVIAQEVQEVEKTAVAFAVQLGFERKTLKADFKFEIWYCPPGIGPAGEARSRCLDALNDTLTVNTDKNPAEWIKDIERSFAVLRRDIPKAAPRPDAAALLRAKKGDQGWQGHMLRQSQLAKDFLASKIVPIDRARPRDRALDAQRRATHV